MTAAELYLRAKRRGYYTPKLTRNMFRTWLLQLCREGLLEKRGARFYLTSDGREIAGCIAGDVIRDYELARAA